MKVAITCDYILGKGPYLDIIENLCALYPEAPIYCFAHQRGAIGGAVEQRRIFSTYLSNIVQTEEDFFRHDYKLPSLAKNLCVSCQYDVIINVSLGHSQGFRRCEKARLISCLYDLPSDVNCQKGWWRALFRPYLQSWITDTLLKADALYVFRQDLLEKCQGDTSHAQVIVAPIGRHDLKFKKIVSKLIANVL